MFQWGAYIITKTFFHPLPCNKVCTNSSLTLIRCLVGAFAGDVARLLAVVAHICNGKTESDDVIHYLLMKKVYYASFTNHNRSVSCLYLVQLLFNKVIVISEARAIAAESSINFPYVTGILGSIMTLKVVVVVQNFSVYHCV